MKGSLNIKIYKNSDLNYEENNIKYKKEDKKYIFYMNDVKNILYFSIDKLEYSRENNEYYYELILDKKNSCKYLLKEINSYVDIIVDDGEFSFIDNLLTINYQLESDDKYTTIEILFN